MARCVASVSNSGEPGPEPARIMRGFDGRMGVPLGPGESGRSDDEMVEPEKA